MFLGERVHESEALALDERLRYWLAVQFLQFWLVIEQFQLARSARHKQENHALGLGRVVRLLRGQRISDCRRSTAFIKKRAQRHRADADGAIAEEMSARFQE